MLKQSQETIVFALSKLGSQLLLSEVKEIQETLQLFLKMTISLKSLTQKRTDVQDDEEFWLSTDNFSHVPLDSEWGL